MEGDEGVVEGTERDALQRLHGYPVLDAQRSLVEQQHGVRAQHQQLRHHLTRHTITYVIVTSSRQRMSYNNVPAVHN